MKAQLGLTKPKFPQNISSAIKTEKNLSESEVTAANCLSDVNNASDSITKIHLFMSLFKGRDDVYAKRWENKLKESFGYAPVCLNLWRSGVCFKPKITCAKCTHKSYATLDEDVIENHLRGNIVAGIYPLLPDDTCSFLAMDFDKEEWKNDISMLRDVCIEFNIPVAVERSRSGKGGHLWFFFENKMSAALARKFGTALLTFSMSRRHEIRFKSYDRLFPSQDTMPKGGLGNLIALPLQKSARGNANSEFVDESFKSYPDQWAFLSTIEKISANHLDHLIAKLCQGHELGLLKIDVKFNGRLRDEQPLALKSLLQHDSGILSGTTAFGKTIVAIKLIAERKVNTLILVDKISLLSQWKEKLSEFLVINESLSEQLISKTGKRRRKKKIEIIGQLGGGKNSLCGIVDIAVMQSVSRQGEVKECVKNYGMIIADECHHAAAFTYEQILKTANAKYIYGLTATPIRKDGLHPILFMYCGPIRYRDNPKKQAKKRPFDHYIIPRFTSLRIPLGRDGSVHSGIICRNYRQ